MTKTKAILFILGVSLFIIACHKGEEGFPKSEKDKFTTRFIFRNETENSIKDISLSGNVYYPFENETLTQNHEYAEIKKGDSVYFEFREPVYTDCKSNINFSLTYSYQAADTIPVDTFTNSFVTDYQVINYGQKDFSFNWTEDVIKNSLK